eukprot:4614540-Pleurochrysis_carterae.AAC.1
MVSTPTVNNDPDVFALGSQAARMSVAMAFRSSCNRHSGIRSDAKIYGRARSAARWFALVLLHCVLHEVNGGFRGLDRVMTLSRLAARRLAKSRRVRMLEVRSRHVSAVLYGSRALSRVA